MNLHNVTLTSLVVLGIASVQGGCALDADHDVEGIDEGEAEAMGLSLDEPSVDDPAGGLPTDVVPDVENAAAEPAGSNEEHAIEECPPEAQGDGSTDESTYFEEIGDAPDDSGATAPSSAAYCTGVRRVYKTYCCFNCPSYNALYTAATQYCLDRGHSYPGVTDISICYKVSGSPSYRRRWMEFRCTC
jgi:hypothetical protein